MAKADIQKLLLEAKQLNIDEQLSALKSKKNTMGKMFDREINQLELQKNANKSVQQTLASEEKEAKLKEELIRSVLEAQTPTMPGTVDQMIPMEPEAQGFPILPQGS
jgi:hypothetical protein